MRTGQRKKEEKNNIRNEKGDITTNAQILK